MTVITLDNKITNKTMQCNWCGKQFLGSRTLAITHRSGQGTGETCRSKIPQDVVASLIPEVIPHRISAEDVNPAPAKKALTQQSITSFGQSFVESAARRELGLFAYTSGITFNALKNPHFIAYCKILNLNFTVPSVYTIAHPQLEFENAEVEKWKAKVLASNLICLTGRCTVSFTPREGMDCRLTNNPSLSMCFVTPS